MTPIGAIEASAFGQAMRESSWLFPAVKAIHLAGITMLVGSIAMLDLRLLGVGRSFPVRRLAARALPWSAGSFALILPSGLAMFVAHVNAAVFHAGVYRSAGRWDVAAMPPWGARAAAALSLLLWFSVIACGLRLAGA